MCPERLRSLHIVREWATKKEMPCIVVDLCMKIHKKPGAGFPGSACGVALRRESSMSQESFELHVRIAVEYDWL